MRFFAWVLAASIAATVVMTFAAPAFDAQTGTGHSMEAFTANDDALQVRVGYLFSDGSFDEWANGTGFAVGKHCVVTKRSLIDLSKKNYFYQKTLQEKKENYRRLGIDLDNSSETREPFRIYITDAKGNSIPAHVMTMIDGLGLVTTKESMIAPAVIFLFGAYMIIRSLSTRQGAGLSTALLLCGVTMVTAAMRFLA